MSKYQNTLAVSSSANRAASARLQSENSRANAVKLSQKVSENVQETIDEEPKKDTPLASEQEIISEAAADVIA